jgi:hypothetical protein
MGAKCQTAQKTRTRVAVRLLGGWALVLPRAHVSMRKMEGQELRLETLAVPSFVAKVIK